MSKCHTLEDDLLEFYHDRFDMSYDEFSERFVEVSSKWIDLHLEEMRQEP